MKFNWFMIGANSVALLMNLRDGSYGAAIFSATALLIFLALTFSVSVRQRT